MAANYQAWVNQAKENLNWARDNLELTNEAEKVGLRLNQDFSPVLAELSEFYFDARYPDEAAFKKIELKQAGTLSMRWLNWEWWQERLTSALNPTP